MEVRFEGQKYNFPDDATDQEIAGALEKYRPKGITDSETYTGAAKAIAPRARAGLTAVAATLAGPDESIIDTFSIPDEDKELMARDWYGKSLQQIRIERDAGLGNRKSLLEQSRAYRKEAQDALPPNQTLGGKVVSGAIQSVGQMAPALGVGLVAGPAAAAGVMGATSFADAAATGVEKGASTGAIGATSAGVATAEIGTEYLPFRYLLSIAGGSNILTNTLKFIAAEEGTELLATMIQGTIEKIGYEPNKPMSEFRKQMQEDLVLTALSTPLTAGAQAGIAHSLRKLDEKVSGKRMGDLVDEQLEKVREAAIRAQAADELADMGLPVNKDKAKADLDRELGTLQGRDLISSIANSSYQPSEATQTTPINSDTLTLIQSIDQTLNPEEISDEQMAGARETVRAFEAAKAATPARVEALTFLSGINELNAGTDLGEIGESAKVAASARRYLNENDSIPRSERLVSIATAAGQEGKQLQQTDVEKTPGIYVLGTPTADRPEIFLRALVDTMEPWRQQWLPNASIILSNESLPSRAAVGWHTRLPSGAHVIVPAALRGMKDPAKFNTNAQIKTFYNLAHEFGHALVDDRFFEGLPPEVSARAFREARDGLVTEETLAQLPEAQAAVVREFNEIKQRVLDGSMTATEFQQEWMGPAKVHKFSLANEHYVAGSAPATQLVDSLIKRSIRTNESLPNEQLASLRNEYLGLHEYLAEQTARYAYAKEWDQKSALNRDDLFARAFASARATLVKFFKQLKQEKIVAPGAKFQEWLDGLTSVPASPQALGENAEGKITAEKAKTKPKAKKAAAKKKTPKPVDHNVATKNPDVGEYRKLVTGLVKNKTINLGDETYKRLMGYLKANDYSTFIDEIQPMLEKNVKFELDDEIPELRASVDLRRMLDLVGHKMYAAGIGDTILKETLQNSVDATMAEAKVAGPDYDPWIDFSIDHSGRSITVEDNGRGMTLDEVATKFLALAAAGKEAGSAGGFGMAKAAFLFGPARVALSTTRNGKTTRLEATREDLLEQRDLRQQASVTDTPQESNGTTLQVWLPKEYTDENGQVRPVEMPYGWGLESSMMIAPVEVRLDGKVLPIGKNFPLGGYYAPLKIKFAWGEADFYIEKEKSKYADFKVLSYGVPQFSDSQPWNAKFKLRHKAILDVRPSVSASHSLYPFNLQREGYKPKIKDTDIDSFFKYVELIAAKEKALSAKSAFANVKQMQPVASMVGKHVKPKTKEFAHEEQELDTTKLGKEIQVADGKVTVDDKVVYDKKEKEKYKSTMVAPEITFDDLLLDMEEDPKKPLMHNNTNFDPVEWGEANGLEDAGLLMAKLGTITLEFRNLIAEVPSLAKMKERILKGFAGISLDKGYAGVNVTSPYVALFINPLYNGFKVRNAAEFVGLYKYVLVHEAAHYIARGGHGDRFVSAEAQLFAEIESLGGLAHFEKSLQDVTERHFTTLEALRNEFAKSSVENTGDTLEDSEELRSQQVDGDPGDARGGRRGSGGSQTPKRGIHFELDAEEAGFLDDSKYFYHAVLNDSDIPSIFETGLRKETNVSRVGGQAFSEGETVLVFQRGDYRLTQKSYQDDELVMTGKGKPVAILKETDPFVRKGLKGEELNKAYREAEELYAEAEAIVTMISKTIDKSEKEVWNLIWARDKAALGELYNRGRDADRIQERTFRKLDEIEKLEGKPNITVDDVLAPYTKYGVPVYRFSLKYREGSDDVEPKIHYELDDDGEVLGFGVPHAGSELDSKTLADAAAEWKKLGFRSKYFKAWFGDWQGDPAASSKVVTAHGQPLVVYHATQATVQTPRGEEPFLAFDYAEGNINSGGTAIGFHFGTVRAAHARGYEWHRRGMEPTQELIDSVIWSEQFPLAMGWKEQDVLAGSGLGEAEVESTLQPFYIMPLVLNLRNPLDLGDVNPGFWYDPRIAANVLFNLKVLDQVEMQQMRQAIEKIHPMEDEFDLANELVVTALKAKGYDGLKYTNRIEGDTSWVAFDPEQIKSVLGTKVFSRNPSIHLELDFDEAAPDGHAARKFRDKFKGFFSDFGPFRRALRHVTNLQYKTLQLQQLSHLNPDLPDLSYMVEKNGEYNRYKGELQAQADRVSTIWNGLGKENFSKVNKFLLAEQDSGTLWVDLVRQPDGKFVYTASETFYNKLKEHKIDPDSAEGKELAALILEIKNSLLKHIDEAQATLTMLLARRYAAAPAGILQAAIIPLSKQIHEIRKQPFFPQGRFGNYIVTIEKKRERGPGYEVVHREAFESEADWARFTAEAQKRAKPDERVRPHKLTDSEYVLMSLPQDFLELAASELGLSNDQVEHLLDILQPVKSEKALKAYDRSRLGIKGASTDALRSYANFMWHNSNLLAKLRYRADFNLAIRGIGASLRQTQYLTGPEALLQVDRLSRVKRYMERTRDYVMSPPNEAHMARAFVSLAYLAYNVKTALLNLYGLITTASDLTTRFGSVEGSKILAEASYAALRSIQPFDLNAARPVAMKPEWQAGLDRALAEGVLSQSYAYHLAGMANSANLYRLPSRQVLGRISQQAIDLGMWTFRLTELSARRITFLATLEAELRQGNEGFSDAYTNAVAATNKLQNDYSLGNRVPFMRGIKTQSGNPVVEAAVPLATVFMSFAQHMAFHAYGGYEVGQRRQQILDGKKPSNPILGYTAKIWIITLLLAGYEGLPGAENLLDLLDALWKKLSGKPVRQEFREYIQAVGGDPVYWSRGMGHNVFGFDVSRSLGFGRFVPGTDTLAKTSTDLQRDVGTMVFDLAGPTGGMIEWMLKTAFDNKPLSEGFKRTPGAVGNVITAYGWSQEGVKAPSGALITRDLNTGELRDLTTVEIFGKALGFNPTVVAQNREIIFEQHDSRMYWLTRRQRLLQDHWRAYVSQDREAIADTRRAINEFNEGIPEEYRGRLRVTPKEIADSTKAHRRTLRLEEMGQSPHKRYRELYKDVSDSFRDPSE